MATLISHSPAETELLGETLGRGARHGMVIGLSGDLGAGKTQLVRGIARGLGHVGRVHSPTFTLLNQYEGGRLPLFHLDLYRLNSDQEIIAAGLESYLDDPPGVAVVEWAGRWGAWKAANDRPPGLLLQVGLEILNEESRRITYEDSGA